MVSLADIQLLPL